MSCTPARRGRTILRHGHAEGYPTTRLCVAHHAHVVPRTSVNRPSSRVGFLHGRRLLPSRGHVHPSPRVVATQRRCLFGMSLDAAVSRCGASTPRHVFCEPAFVPRVSVAGTRARGRAGAHPSAQDRGVALLVVAPPRLRARILCMPRCRLCEPAFEPCLTGGTGGSSARCRPGHAHPSA
jgi:hypothetical protein